MRLIYVCYLYVLMFILFCHSSVWLVPEFLFLVTGLLDQIGPRLFGELIGLPVACKDCLKPGLSLAYVIDTSLSMSTDFQQIQTKVAETIQSALRENQSTPSDFILSTFSDPGKLLTYL